MSARGSGRDIDERVPACGKKHSQREAVVGLQVFLPKA
jgi:hypothetical protein